jgi:hypothetical protein
MSTRGRPSRARLSSTDARIPSPLKSKTQPSADAPGRTSRPALVEITSGASRATSPSTTSDAPRW